jgi:hypothetical protein
MKQTSYKHDKHRDVNLGKVAVEGVTGFQTLIEDREPAMRVEAEKLELVWDRDRSAYS